MSQVLRKQRNTNFKRVFWTLFLHFEIFIFGTSVFVLLFSTDLLKNIEVFFYRGISLLFVASFVTLFVATFVKITSSGKTFTIRDILLSFVLVFCLNLVFFTHVPVTADRSVSVFLLRYMNNYSEERLTEQEITQVFIEKYLYGQQNMQKRFREQIVSGNITFNNGVYRITEQGMFVVSIYDSVSDLFVLDKKNTSL